MTESFLSALQIAHFKCFEQLRIPFESLTVLSGFNGAGKSSALQPILLLAQAARGKTWIHGRTESQLALNGAIIRLGSAGDVIGSKSPDGTAEFQIFGKSDSIKLNVSGKTSARSLTAHQSPDSSEWPELFDKLARLVHLSAVRQGPADSFQMPDQVSGQSPDVGADGRFACYWYHEYADKEVPRDRCFGSETATTFRKQLDAWLDYLAPGANANVQAFAVASTLALEFRLSDTGEWRRPANVGYGLVYAFPILVALLAAEIGDIIVIDSPEAHLHPQAQSRMGKMLATFAAAGIQIIVETHSDHILNGIRLAVRDQKLPSSQLSILFFVGSSLDGHGVTSPRIDDQGRIDEWPEGFFDQNDKDVAQLAGLV